MNGSRVSSPTELAHGDLVQFGQVRLRFIDRNSDGGAPGQGGGKERAGPAGQQSRERLGTALTFAAGINVVGLLGNSLASCRLPAEGRDGDLRPGGRGA